MQCQRNKICIYIYGGAAAPAAANTKRGEREQQQQQKDEKNYVVVRAQFSVRDFVKMVCAVPDRWMCHICFE